MLEHESSVTLPISKYQYENVQELISEWQASKDERSLWEYLGLTETVFKDWVRRVRDGIIDV